MTVNSWGRGIFFVSLHLYSVKEGCVLRFLTPLDARIGRFLHFIGKKTVTAFGIGGTDPMIMCNLK